MTPPEAPPGYDVGADLVEVEHVRRSLAEHGERWLTRVFTTGEVAAAAGAPERLAARMAAKEAVLKLLRDDLVDLATPWTDVEVVGAGGPPSLALHGAVGRAVTARWDELSLTLAHEDCHALAVVLARRRTGRSEADLTLPGPRASSR